MHCDPVVADATGPAMVHAVISLRLVGSLIT